VNEREPGQTAYLMEQFLAGFSSSGVDQIEAAVTVQR
jgi:hypothetical protein